MRNGLKVQMQTLMDTFIDFIHIAYVESIYNNKNLCEVLKLSFTFLYVCPPGPNSVYTTADHASSTRAPGLSGRALRPKVIIISGNHVIDRGVLVGVSPKI